MLIAILDADVLFPMLLRDTLLRAAAAGCFRLHWSTEILDEVVGNLVRDYGMDAGKASALRDLMEDAYPDANVEGWQGLEAAMRNHPKDRHVVAAAVAAGADVIVTSNVRDFQILPPGIVAVRPDEFLLKLIDTCPAELRTALVQQAAGYSRPAMTVGDLFEALRNVAPQFVAKALAYFAGQTR
jgi:predicted nucleic acid-binding protein